MKAASSKRWKEIEKKPLKRKTISTDMGRNTNKRFQKLLLKDAKRLSKLRDDDNAPGEEGQDDGAEMDDDEGWQQTGNDDEDDGKLASDEEFASDDEEINSDEC